MNIRKQLRSIATQISELEDEANLIYKIRDSAKKESGRLSEKGKGFIDLYKDELSQSEIAKILGISQSAISQYLTKNDKS
jgi:DNA-directed RNA polymerase specialized sigma subunit